MLYCVCKLKLFLRKGYQLWKDKSYSLILKVIVLACSIAPIDLADDVSSDNSSEGLTTKMLCDIGDYRTCNYQPM